MTPPSILPTTQTCCTQPSWRSRRTLTFTARATPCVSAPLMSHPPIPPCWVHASCSWKLPRARHAPSPWPHRSRGHWYVTGATHRTTCAAPPTHSPHPLTGTVPPASSTFVPAGTSVLPRTSPCSATYSLVAPHPTFSRTSAVPPPRSPSLTSCTPGGTTHGGLSHQQAYSAC